MNIPTWLTDTYRRRRDWRILNPSEHDVIRRYQRRFSVRAHAARLVDSIVRVFVRSNASRDIPPPRRILLANLGGLGDVVLSTPAIGIVRKAFPQAWIGFLLGSWARPVLKEHPHIQHLHVLNHWKIVRTGEPLRRRMLHYFRAASMTARELRQTSYDVAVDLRAWWPTAAYVLWRAGIPARIGHPSAGLGALLTHPRPFVYRRLHESQIQTELLRSLPIPPDLFAGDPLFDMPPPSLRGQEQICRLLGVDALECTSYDVLHVGSGADAKNWPAEKWAALADRLSAEGRTLVLTGAGSRDQAMIRQITAGRGACINACDALDWDGFVEAIRAAKTLYTVDTVTTHLAVALGTPSVTVLGGMSDWLQWGPRNGPLNVALTKPMACAPCFHYCGCTTRPCLTQIDVDSVYAAGRAILREVRQRG